MKKQIILAVLGFSALSILAQTECKIKGKVIDRPESKKLYLLPLLSDPRTTDKITIPIINNEFEYTFQTKNPEAYEFIFEDELNKGYFHSVRFITEDGTVNFELYPAEEYSRNIIKGSELNSEYQKIKKQSDSLFCMKDLSDQEETLYKNNELYSDLYTQWINALRTTDDQNKLDSLYKVRDSFTNETQYSDKGIALANQVSAIRKQQNSWILNEINKHSSEATLSLLYEKIYSSIQYSDQHIDQNKCFEIFNSKFQKEFAQNNMTKKINIMIAASQLKKGGKYIDVTATDLNGKKVLLSDHIKGKVALIDLWASWCGPCIRKTKTFIPILEKYKDKGFTIVGIAREQKNTDAMLHAIDKHQFNWTNLVELNDNGKIWLKYGIDNGAGAVFLVDKEGTIIATNFDAHELENHLKDLLD